MAIKFLGISDEHTTCMACGKTNLKRTIVLDFDGDVRHYGSDCAANALGSRSRKVIDSRVEVLEYVQQWLGKVAAGKIAVDVRRLYGVTAVCRGGVLYLGAWGAVKFRNIPASPEAIEAARGLMVKRLEAWIAAGGECSGESYWVYRGTVNDFVAAIGMRQYSDQLSN